MAFSVHSHSGGGGQLIQSGVQFFLFLGVFLPSFAFSATATLTPLCRKVATENAKPVSNPDLANAAQFEDGIAVLEESSRRGHALSWRLHQKSEAHLVGHLQIGTGPAGTMAILNSEAQSSGSRTQLPLVVSAESARRPSPVFSPRGKPYDRFSNNETSTLGNAENVDSRPFGPRSRYSSPALSGPDPETGRYEYSSNPLGAAIPAHLALSNADYLFETRVVEVQPRPEGGAHQTGPDRWLADTNWRVKVVEKRPDGKGEFEHWIYANQITHAAGIGNANIFFSDRSSISTAMGAIAAAGKAGFEKSPPLDVADDFGKRSGTPKGLGIFLGGGDSGFMAANHALTKGDSTSRAVIIRRGLSAQENNMTKFRKNPNGVEITMSGLEQFHFLRDGKRVTFPSTQDQEGRSVANIRPEDMQGLQIEVVFKMGSPAEKEKAVTFLRASDLGDRLRENADGTVSMVGDYGVIALGYSLPDLQKFFGGLTPVFSTASAPVPEFQNQMMPVGRYVDHFVDSSGKNIPAPAGFIAGGVFASQIPERLLNTPGEKSPLMPDWVREYLRSVGGNGSPAGLQYHLPATGALARGPQRIVGRFLAEQGPVSGATHSDRMVEELRAHPESLLGLEVAISPLIPTLNGSIQLDPSKVPPEFREHGYSSSQLSPHWEVVRTRVEVWLSGVLREFALPGNEVNPERPVDITFQRESATSGKIFVGIRGLTDTPGGQRLLARLTSEMPQDVAFYLNGVVDFNGGKTMARLRFHPNGTINTKSVQLVPPLQQYAEAVKVAGLTTTAEGFPQSLLGKFTKMPAKEAIERGVDSPETKENIARLASKYGITHGTSDGLVEDHFTKPGSQARVYLVKSRGDVEGAPPVGTVVIFPEADYGRAMKFLAGRQALKDAGVNSPPIYHVFRNPQHREHSDLNSESSIGFVVEAAQGKHLDGLPVAERPAAFAALAQTLVKLHVSHPISTDPLPVIRVKREEALRSKLNDVLTRIEMRSEWPLEKINFEKAKIQALFEKEIAQPYTVSLSHGDLSGDNVFYRNDGEQMRVVLTGTYEVGVLGSPAKDLADYVHALGGTEREVMIQEYVAARKKTETSFPEPEFRRSLDFWLQLRTYR